jgi:hypothetical protein
MSATAETPAGATAIRPFRVDIPEEALDDLRSRIAATRLPEKETVADRSQGVGTDRATDRVPGDAPRPCRRPVLRVEEKLNEILFAQEVFTHLVVRNTIDAWLASAPDDLPVRPARRLLLLDAALEPVAAKLEPKQLRRLRSALALTIGTEAVLAPRDVCVDTAETREVTRWASEALVRQALLDARART